MNCFSTHNYDVYIVPSAPSGLNDLVMHLPSGAQDILRIEDSSAILPDVSTTLTPPQCSQYIATSVSNSANIWSSVTLTWADQSKWEFTLLPNNAQNTLVLTKIIDKLGLIDDYGRSISLRWYSDRRLDCIFRTGFSQSPILTFNYEGNLLKQVKAITEDLSKQVAVYTRTNNGNISDVNIYGNTSEIVSSTRYTYDSSSNLTGIIDPDPSTDAGWKTHVFEYSTVGNTTRVTSEGEKADNGTWKHKYNYVYNIPTDTTTGSTVVTEQNSSNEVIAKYTYFMDTRGRDLGKADANGNRNYVEYGDPRFPYFPTSERSPLSIVTKTEYGYTGLVERTISSLPFGSTDDNDAIVTTNTNNYLVGPFGRIVRSQVSVGTTRLPETTYTYYEPFGQLKSVTGPRPGSNNLARQSTVMTYNDHGDLVSTTGVNHLNESITASTQYTYNYNPPFFTGASRDVIQKDRFGKKTSSTRYDSRGLVYKDTQYMANEVAGRTTDYLYNSASQVIKVRTSYPNATLGQNSGVVNTYAYLGGPLKKVETYSGLDSNWQPIEPTVLHVTENVYDYYGNVISVTTDGLTVHKTYDVIGRLQTMTDPDGKTTTYNYDNGIGATTPAGGNTWGQLINTVYPDGSVVTVNDYDNGGRATKITDANGVTSTFTYAPVGAAVGTRGQLVQIERNKGTQNELVNYQYDSFGRSTSTTDKEGTYTTVYDAAGEVSDQITTYDCLGVKVPWTKHYTRNPNGSLATMRLHGGLQDQPPGIYAYDYDKYDRESSVSRPFAITGATTKWAYEDDGRLKSQDLWGVANSTYTYNLQGQLKGLVHTQGGIGGPTQQFSNFQYRDDGKLIGFHTAFKQEFEGRVRNSRFAGDTAMVYDSKNRLVSFSCPGLSSPLTYAYDTNGNPTTFAGQAVDATYGASNQRQGTGYAYDSNGNPTTYKGQTLTYDMLDRMTKYGNAFTTGYRSDGKRAWRQIDGRRVYFIYDGENLLAEVSAIGSELLSFNTWGPTGLIARDTYDSSSSQWNTVAYLHDPLGNVTQRLSVQRNEMLSTYQFDAYGNVINCLNGYCNQSVIDASDPYGYKGQYGYYTEPSIGLILCTNKYYDSSVGRWLTRDPVGYSGGLNLYAYCMNDPINGVDPSGNCNSGNLERNGILFDPWYDGMWDSGIGMGTQLMASARVRFRYQNALATYGGIDDGLAYNLRNQTKIKYNTKPDGTTLSIAMTDTFNEMRKNKVDTRTYRSPTKSNVKVNANADWAIIGGRTLVVAGVAASVYNVANSDNKPRALSEEAGGWAGSVAGGEGGAIVGAAVGVWFAGVGAAPGAVVGGIIGAIVGGIGGNIAGGNAYDLATGRY